MKLFKRDRLKFPVRPSWRDYQDQLNSSAKSNRQRRPLPLLLVGLGCLLFFFYWGFSYWGFSAPRAGLPSESSSNKAGAQLIDKKDVQLLLQRTPLHDLLAPQVLLPFKNQQLTVETCLDPAMQSLLTAAIDRRNSRYVGVVVMDADTGRILALAGFDKDDPGANPCLLSSFPAASLFKIVTAAAAIERFHFTGETPVHFNGWKHTLYKSQLRERTNGYTQTLSFADSFAHSVNPVFGMIGKQHLGRQVLEQYGAMFGFNQPIDFELPVPPSHLAVEDDPYQLAEVASGFNYDTTLSPLHAAMMVSAVLNKGRMIAPVLVERIVAAGGREVYRSQTVYPSRVMSPGTSAILAEMMEATVHSGTARRFFRNLKRDRVLSLLSIGGKTGSISNRTHDTRFDWFAGFAEARNGSGRLIVAAMVGHEDYIGTRAGTYARMAMSHYFQTHFAEKAAHLKKSEI